MPRMLKRALEGILTPEEVPQIYGGFDVVGDVAIIKIPDELLSKKHLIAKAIMDNVKSVKTVLRQATPISGEYRTRELEHLMGEEKAIAMHKEHGCTFKVDLAKVYFSPRLSAERLRVAKKVKEGEVIVNMFAGIGTFSILIVRLQPKALVYSIDINRKAYQLMVENIRLNKMAEEIIPILGDARAAIEGLLQGVADRVLMPLPERASQYLDVAMKALKPKGGILHYYTHIHTSKGEDAVEKAKGELHIGEPHTVLEGRVVREVGPRWSQVVIDLLMQR